MNPSRWICLAVCLVLWLPSFAAATTIDCGTSSGYDIRFETTGGPVDPQSGDRCSDTFECAQPVSPGGFVNRVDNTCDPEVGDCLVELRFPLTFRGNEENISNVGFIFGAPTPVVYWWDGAADMDCRPWQNSNCGQEGICGEPGAQIGRDEIETFLRLGLASCAAPTPDKMGVFSILASSCPVGSSCPKREFDSLDVTEREVKKGLGCVEPPMDDCEKNADCTACLMGGSSAGGGGPSGGGPPGDPEGPSGEGAYLYYRAGGAGAQGLPGSAEHRVALGRHWNHSYAQRLVPAPDETRVYLITDTAIFREWSNPDGSGVYTSVRPSNEYRTLTWLGTGLGWQMRELDGGAIHAFDASGKWVSSTDRNGNAKTATYSGDQLTSVAFPDGTREDFGYDAGTGKLTSITKVGVGGADSRTWTYTWSGDDLVRIDRPDGTALRYVYGDPSHPGYLTRIEVEGTDGTSVRIVRAYGYDAQANVVRTWRGDVAPDGPDAVDLWTYAYDDPAEPTETEVTDPLGNVATYQLARDTVSDNVKVTSIEGSCPTCGLGPNTQLFYDDPAHPMLPTRTVDGRGFETLVSYDLYGQVTSRTEAVGEPEERTTTWTYDPTYPSLVTAVEQPSVAGSASVRATDWTRDAAGNVTQQTASGVESGSAFALSTVTTYNAAGQPLSLDPPGHGSADETTWTYDAARGDLLALIRTDPLVGDTLFAYDPFNRRTSVTDPNDVTTETTYDALNRVTEIRRVGATPPTDDLVTTHEYNAFGDLLRTTLPRGNVVDYAYDPAGRLVSIERKPDASTPGERVTYEFDAVGHRIRETLERWDGSGWQAHAETAHEYSTRCHLDRTIQAPGTAEEAITEYGYDCNGHLSTQWDPNHDSSTDPPTTSYGYDALDRLVTLSQPWGGTGGGTITTTYGFDIQDHLTSVTDAEGNTTTYEYSDRDLLTEEDSPASGVTIHNYTDSGELSNTTDARGITTTYTHDALDRTTFVDYADDTLDIAYTYDNPAVPFSSGRLTAITRNSGSVPYEYDRFGRTTRDGALTYQHDANGNRTAVGYPGGVTATFTHDFADREETLAVTTPSGTTGWVTASSYLPSGPLTSLTLGNGLAETRTFDGRYVPTGYSVTGGTDHTWTYVTDRVGNILSITEQAGCSQPPLLLENQTVIGPETVEHCNAIEAGTGFTVDSGGDLTLQATGAVVLSDGFSVASGGAFVAVSQPAPSPVVETYTYQDIQYFLTQGDGPWGARSWTYDRIGNRLTETRDGLTDSYTYAQNPGGGNTPVLAEIDLGVLGTKTFTHGAAGHLEQISTSATVGTTLAYDDAGRLSELADLGTTQSTDLLYDGRSYLTSAAGTAAAVTPVYSSSGLLHSLVRPSESVHVLYFAGRPVGQVTIDSSSAESFLYYTTDHLGTPSLATDGGGGEVWSGGFEPFGRDWQEATAAGASENGVDLRLPGQWVDGSWGGPRSTAYYNVHRWLVNQLGIYSRTDPLGLIRGDLHVYRYTRSNPLVAIDPFGLKTCVALSARVGLGLALGDHSGLLVDDTCKPSNSCSGPGPLLYDPAGGYAPQFPGSGSAQVLNGNIEDWSPSGYLDYQCESGSDIVEIYCFETSCCEEQKINQQASPAGAFSCASGVGAALRGVGPFAELGSSATPALLRRSINRILRDNPGAGAGTFTFTCPESLDP